MKNGHEKLSHLFSCSGIFMYILYVLAKFVLALTQFDN